MREFLNTRIKLLFDAVSAIKRGESKALEADKIGFIDLEEVDKLSKQPYLIKLEQEFDDAYQSGDSERIAAVEKKRASLTNPELFAIGILIEDRLKKAIQKMEGNN